MLKILAVCGNGMGTSMVMKMKVKNVTKRNNIAADVDSCSLGESSAKVGGVDVVIASEHLAGELKVKAKDKIVIGLKNLMDEKELEPKLLAALNK